jgi:DNA-binding transcriptional LysR family regulator
MELQQIEYFLLLARELHFWNSAEKLFITQSALSRQIKALEDELGMQLFERSKRTVKLTPAGAFLAEQWTRLLEDIGRTHRQARAIHEGAQGTLRIGYPGSTTYAFLPELIAHLAQEAPGLRIELVEPTDISFEQLLLNYQMDIAFRRDPAENGALLSEPLYDEPFALIVPAAHHLTQERFTSLQQVKDEAFILSGLHHKTFYVASLHRIFAQYGFQPDVHIESDFGGMVLSLVARGLGVSIMPASYARSAPPGVRFIELPHKTRLYAAWRRDDHNPVLQRALDAMRIIAGQFGALR